MNTEPQSVGARRRIIDAARALIHRDGYTNVGITSICAEAKVAKGSFYHFFPTKRDLLDVVVSENQAIVMQGLAEIGHSFGNGRDKIIAQFQAILDSARDQKSREGRILGCSIGALASELGAENEQSTRALGEWQEKLETLIRQGVDDGSLAPTVSPRDTAYGLLAVIQGMSTLGRSFDDPDLLERIAQTAVKRMLPARANA